MDFIIMGRQAMLTAWQADPVGIIPIERLTKLDWMKRDTLIFFLNNLSDRTRRCSFLYYPSFLRLSSPGPSGSETLPQFYRPEFPSENSWQIMCLHSPWFSVPRTTNHCLRPKAQNCPLRLCPRLTRNLVIQLFIQNEVLIRGDTNPGIKLTRFEPILSF